MNIPSSFCVSFISFYFIVTDGCDAVTVDVATQPLLDGSIVLNSFSSSIV